MEKGSFHTSVTATDEAVRKVALPNQLPKGIDFSDLPVGQLKSATLETLINQNEDLMARLSVSLRRTHEFEDKVQRLENENANLRSRFETLKEQYMLTQEKDRISTSRVLQIQEENLTNRRNLEKLEKIYSELFVQAQSFQQRVIRLERHQARLRKAARNLQKIAKNVPQLRQELDHSVLVHQQSVQSYEAKLSDVRVEIESMRGKVAERDFLYAEKVKHENQLIYERRQNEIHREEQLTLIDRLSQENTSMRTQIKETLVTNEGLRQELTKVSSELPNIMQANQNLTEQVESLQALWSHKQKELDGMSEKNKALQKLNQSISVTLNQQRKEIHSIQQELDKERFTSSEKIKTLLAEIQMLRAKL